MAITAQVVDGKVVANYTSSTNTSEKTTGSDSMNKDSFLQILAAEMKYQDPLEPSSNTDWVSQMSSFSQVEELQNLGDAMDEQGASNLVGKRVILAASTGTDGEINYVSGVVQCIEKRSDGVYLSVNDYLYKLDTLYSVVDEDYYNKLMAEADGSADGKDTTDAAGSDDKADSGDKTDIGDKTDAAESTDKSST